MNLIISLAGLPFGTGNFYKARMQKPCKRNITILLSTKVSNSTNLITELTIPSRKEQIFQRVTSRNKLVL